MQMTVAIRRSTVRPYMMTNEILNAGLHPMRGCIALTILWAKIRLTTKIIRTPAETNIKAAMEREALVG